MKRSRFTQEQVIAVLKEHQAGAAVADLCRKHGISDATFYTWRSKYGGMEVSDAKRLRVLEDENARLKKLLAESMLDVSTLKGEAVERTNRAKTADARLAARCRDLGDAAEGLLAAARVRARGHGAQDVPLCEPTAGRHGGPAAAASLGG